jgi:hypothetical protein
MKMYWGSGGIPPRILNLGTKGILISIHLNMIRRYKLEFIRCLSFRPTVLPTLYEIYSMSQKFALFQGILT